MNDFIKGALAMFSLLYFIGLVAEALEKEVK